MPGFDGNHLEFHHSITFGRHGRSPTEADKKGGIGDGRPGAEQSVRL